MPIHANPYNDQMSNLYRRHRWYRPYYQIESHKFCRLFEALEHIRRNHCLNELFWRFAIYWVIHPKMFPNGKLFAKRGPLIVPISVVPDSVASKPSTRLYIWSVCSMSWSPQACHSWSLPAPIPQSNLLERPSICWTMLGQYWTSHWCIDTTFTFMSDICKGVPPSPLVGSQIGFNPD